MLMLFQSKLYVLDLPVVVRKESQVISKVEIVKSCHRCPLYFVVSAWSGSLRDSVNSQEEKEWWRQASLSNTCLDLKKLSVIWQTWIDLHVMHQQLHSFDCLSLRRFPAYHKYVMLQILNLLDGCKCVYTDSVNLKFTEWQIQYQSDMGLLNGLTLGLLWVNSDDPSKPRVNPK